MALGDFLDLSCLHEIIKVLRVHSLFDFLAHTLHFFEATNSLVSNFLLVISIGLDFLFFFNFFTSLFKVTSWKICMPLEELFVFPVQSVNEGLDFHAGWVDDRYHVFMCLRYEFLSSGVFANRHFSSLPWDHDLFFLGDSACLLENGNNSRILIAH